MSVNDKIAVSNDKGQNTTTFKLFKSTLTLHSDIIIKWAVHKGRQRRYRLVSILNDMI